MNQIQNSFQGRVFRHFLFDNKMYKQHNGVAMGAPLAPVVADIFMAHMETSLMDEFMEIGVCEWHRYVDDTFVLIEPTTNVVDVFYLSFLAST